MLFHRSSRVGLSLCHLLGVAMTECLYVAPGFSSSPLASQWLLAASSAAGSLKSSALVFLRSSLQAFKRSMVQAKSTGLRTSMGGTLGQTKARQITPLLIDGDDRMAKP